MTWCSSFIRHFVVPRLFRETECLGCGRTIPLVGRWKCGSHYTDHRERHIATFRCSQGHRLDGFDCPRCHSTILIQGGDKRWLRHGVALRLRTTTTVPEASDETLLVGHNRRGRTVGLPDDRLAWHTAITGGTGRGKSTLLLNLARQLVNRGEGITILDPGGDLAGAVLQQIPREREQDVVWIDVSNRRRPFPLNILAAQTDVERAVMTEELLAVFHRLHGSAWGPLLAHQLRMAFRTVMMTGGTLHDVYGLFVSAETRGRIIGEIDDAALRAFWTDEFPAIPAVRRSAVTNKLSPLVFHPVLGPIVSAADCGLDADRAIRERKVVIVNLASGSPGPDVTTLLGTFLVQKVIAAAFRQGKERPENRVRHFLLVDEFQRFMHRAAAFDQILSESRKFRLALVVANQYVEQLPPTVRAALFGNVGCLAAFRVGHRDARVLLPEYAGAVSDDLLELELGECMVRIGTDWTTVQTPPPPSRPADDPSDRIRSALERLVGGGRDEAEEAGDGRSADGPDVVEEPEFVR
jgi:hypothetical protein